MGYRMTEEEYNSLNRYLKASKMNCSIFFSAECGDFIVDFDEEKCISLRHFINEYIVKESINELINSNIISKDTIDIFDIMCEKLKCYCYNIVPNFKNIDFIE